KKFDLIVDFRSSVFNLLFNAPVLKSSSKSKHHKLVEYSLMLLPEKLALKQPLKPHIWTDQKDAQHAKQLLGNNKTLILAPTANWGGKRWTQENFAKLANRLFEKKAPFYKANLLIAGAQNEQQQITKLLASVAPLNPILSMGRFSLTELATLFKHSTFFIGNDSALMHMACSYDIPTLGLFGPSDERIYGPWNNKGAYLRTEKSFQEIISDPQYDYRSSYSWMNSITVEQVYHQTLKMLSS
ncbi:MAG: glycosyltransferase family 9 protein, partial [Pseudomonadota bacterium]